MHLDCIADLAAPLPVRDDTFQTVILSDVLEHLLSPLVVLREINRILKPRGKLLLNVPFIYWIHEQPFDYYRFTEFALRRLGQIAGFHTLELRPIGGSLEVVVDIVSKHLVKLGWLGEMTARLLQGSAYHFSQTTLGRRVLESSGRLYPLGYFMVAEKTRNIS